MASFIQYFMKHNTHDLIVLSAKRSSRIGSVVEPSRNKTLSANHAAEKHLSELCFRRVGIGRFAIASRHGVKFLIVRTVKDPQMTAGINGLTCFPRHGGNSLRKMVTHPQTNFGNDDKVPFISSAPQSYVVENNLSSFMAGTKLAVKYNGYGACPILTSYRRCILTEFNYDKKIWETFPFDQSKERCICYQINKHIFPPLYWRRLIKGKWNGPAAIRRIINPFKM